MHQLISLVILLNLRFLPTEAQFNSVEVNRPSQDDGTNFQPSLAVVIGILCIMFSLTFILLIYAKFCHRGSTVHGDLQNPALIRSGSRFSGIDKTVIESLPFFKFSSLKGSKNGLECAVCLSKFEDIELLRLLPKCKHAFHIDCVDQWLEKHSSCPLCRCKVSAEDTTIFPYSNSMRFLQSQSDVQDDSSIELFVEREEENSRHGSSRFSIGSSFRKIEKALSKDDQDQVLLIQETEDAKRIFHKFNHKIIISDVVLKNRWSNVSSSDLMFLNSEMIQDMSSNRFTSVDLDTELFASDQMLKIKEEMEKKRLFESKLSSINKPSTSTEEEKSNRIVNSNERRSVSEITGLSRFRNLSIKNAVRESFTAENNEREEYRLRRLWLPIARTTVQWFANRERSSTFQRSRRALQV